VHVVSVLEDAGAKKVPAAIVITAGFKETGAEGKELERQVGETADKHGIALLGPNCMGIINSRWKVNATFTNINPAPGAVAISSQSGAVCSSMLDWSVHTKVGFSKFVSVGNKARVDEAVLVEYLKDDPETKVIGMYIEGTDRGKAFMEQAAAASKKKPIVVIKSGRTDSGSKAASSHTGALAGADKVYDAAFNQAGVLRVTSLDDFFDLLQLFANMPIPSGDGVAIVTNAGGLGVMAADACSDAGLKLADLTDATQAALKAKLPAAANWHNPVDVLGDATADRYEFAIKTVMEDPNVNMVAILLSPLDTVDVTAVANNIASFAGKTSKPIVCAFAGGERTEVGKAILQSANVPCYDSPDRAIRALGGMAGYMRVRNVTSGLDVVSVQGDKKRAAEVIAAVRAQGRSSLSESEGKELLKAYGIKVPSEKTCATAKEAAAEASRIGFPVVLKIDSPDIQHKSDVGGVAVGVKTAEDVERAFDEMMAKVRSKKPQAKIVGVTVCQMVKGKEVLVGMTRDEQFGPVITFGLGGVFVEIMKDVSQRIAPLSQHNVDTMVTSIKSYPILAGARGAKPADVADLKSVIFRIAQIALDFPEISELEVNPVMVGDEGAGAYAVDALVALKK